MIRLFLLLIGTLLASNLAAQSFDLCGDGIDNDGDGLIDEACQPFECDGTLYQTATDNNDFVLFRIDPSTTPMQHIVVANLSQTGNVNDINSIAYNPLDNLMYGMTVNTGLLYRIDATGAVEVMGNVGLNRFKNAGTFDVSGNYYVMGDNTLYKVNINTLSYIQVGSRGLYGSADITYNPLDGQLYGFNGGSPRLLFKMDPNTGAQTKVPGNAPLAINGQWGWMGAMYFTPRGKILGMPGAQFVSLDPTTGVGSFVQPASPKYSTDGCSCSFGIEMTKEVTGSFERGDTVEYTFTLYNQSFAPIAGATFADTLRGGLQWVTAPYDTSRLSYQHLQVTPGDSIIQLDLTTIPQGQSSFKLKAVIPCDYSGSTHSNLAWLNHLPAPLKEDLASDDPTTTVLNDATEFTLRGASPTVQINSQPAICTVQRGSLSVANNLPNVTYQWSTGGTTSSIESLLPGTYTLTITQDNGCSTIHRADVLDESQPLNAFLSKKDNLCFGSQQNGWIRVDSVRGGYPPYSYALDGGDFQIAPKFDALPEGSYSLTVRDQYGCQTQRQLSLLPPSFALSIQAPSNQSALLGERLPLPMRANTLTPVQYQWTPAIGLSCDTCPEPLLIAEKTATYTIIGTDIQGCSDTAEVTITVDNATRVFVPNAFSPNGDGNNDLLMVHSPGDVVLVRSFQVFTRWGERIFVQRNFLPNYAAYAWDGTFLGQPLDPGVLVYVVEVELVDGRVEIVSGDVTLFR